MRKVSRAVLGTVFTGALLAATHAGAQAEQLTLSGSGFFVSNNASRLLPNGDTLALVRNEVMVNPDSGVGVLEGGCVGLGRHTPEDERFRGTAFCTLVAANGQDALVVEIVEPEEDIVEATIVGGSGRWADATGDGVFRTLVQRGDRGMFEFDLNVQTP